MVASCKEWGLGSSICDTIEAFLLYLYPKQEKKTRFLQGNYAPTDEAGPYYDLPVKGSLPAALNGEYVRNGPNPKYEPTYKYHWFDGDGMLHGLRIKDGKAAYVCRFVDTSRLRQETKYGRPLFVKFGDLINSGFGWAMLSLLRTALGVVNTKDGGGTGNTALAFHDRRLLALHEGDKPYWIRLLEDGRLETVGRWSYEGKLGQETFTAHPKVDAVTGEMCFFGYGTKPVAHYGRVSADGVISPSIPITLQNPVMMHDFSITENYAIFMELPLVFEKQAVGKGTCPFEFRKDLNSRFGVLKRDAPSEAGIRWFELPPFMIFHNVNAWEEGDKVVLFGCRNDEFSLGELDQNEKVSDPYLYKFVLDMSTGQAEATQLSDWACEFPRINEAFVGRRHRYAWLSLFDKIEIIGAVKVDLEATPKIGSGRPDGGVAVASFLYGPGRYGGEAVFVPSDKPGAAEDEGYLMTFVHDAKTDKSELVVVNAQTMAPEPVASVLIPRRVPFGFHGIFVSEAQLLSQFK